MTLPQLTHHHATELLNTTFLNTTVLNTTFIRNMSIPLHYFSIFHSTTIQPPQLANNFLHTTSTNFARINAACATRVLSRARTHDATRSHNTTCNLTIFSHIFFICMKYNFIFQTRLGKISQRPLKNASKMAAPPRAVSIAGEPCWPLDVMMGEL